MPKRNRQQQATQELEKAQKDFEKAQASMEKKREAYEASVTTFAEAQADLDHALANPHLPAQGEDGGQDPTAAPGVTVDDE